MNRFLIEQLAPPLRLKDSQAKQNSLLGVSVQLKAGEDITCRTLGTNRYLEAAGSK